MVKNGKNGKWQKRNDSCFPGVRINPSLLSSSSFTGNSHFLTPFQETYYYLLQRYLESACATGCESRRAYLHLIGRLQDLHRINQSHIQVTIFQPKRWSIAEMLLHFFFACSSLVLATDDDQLQKANWHGEPITCWLPETEDQQQTVFFVQQHFS